MHDPHAAARGSASAVSAFNRTSVRTLAAIAVFAGIAAGPATAQAAGNWVSTQSRALPLKSTLLPLPVTAAMPVRIAVALKAQNTALLQSSLKNAVTPGSPQYGVAMTPAQFAANFAPSNAQAQAVASYLTAAGFRNVQIAPNRMLVSADGTAAQAQAAFNTTLAQFPLLGANYFGNTRDVQVPAALSGTVLSVLGLNNLSVAKTSLQKVSPSAGTPALNFSYNASQFQDAYDAGTTPTGSGTVIGIVTAGDDLSTVVSDLRQYESVNGLPQVPVSIVNVAPVGTDTSGDDEWDLDSQSSTGIAGTVKQLVFYNTASLGDADLLLAYNRAVSDGTAKAINMSFGGCELLDALSGGTAASDQAYMEALLQGQTFFASSGDAGAACSVAINLGLPDSGIPDVEYPASSSYVVAVGGTTLLTDSSYGYSLELSWDGGGGGISTFETAPSWQSSVVPTGALGLRGVPDVAMDADPNTGAELIVAGADSVIGGTSLSSPLSVGVWARLESAHCNAYGFAAPLLYALASGPLQSAKGFHDVLAGTNGLYVATPGWDYTTGLGTFDISAINAALPAKSCS